MNTLYDVDTFGQVFTPLSVVQAMLSLRQNFARVLEPSCGNGAFAKHLPGCVAIEIDQRHASKASLNIDFFSYNENEIFETIIGNPPYVRYQDIYPETKKLIKSNLFDRRTNLYLFFIEKSIRHLTEGGELIFITPRDFTKATSCIKLNQWLYSIGTITHVIALGDAKVFSSALPNCLIWRFEKGCFNRTIKYAEISNKDNLEEELKSLKWESRNFVEIAGNLIFSNNLTHHIYMRNIASIKVGAVSGDDKIYTDEKLGNFDFVCSETVKTGKTKRMICLDTDQTPPDFLLQHKQRLIKRGIRKFTEANWWKWGRACPISDAPRIYVNCKTRQNNPFFLHDCNYFDGAILAIFPHNQQINLSEFCTALNKIEWNQLGFICDGRYLFSQRSLENVPLPNEFQRFLPK